jgi:hypothetical protein
MWLVEVQPMGAAEDTLAVAAGFHYLVEVAGVLPQEQHQPVVEVVLPVSM